MLRPRITLRVLLLVVAAIAGFLGWQLKQQRDAKRAIEAIEAKGGMVFTAEEIGNKPLQEAESSWLDELTDNRAASVDSVALTNGRFGDEAVELLKRFPSITHLNITGSRITDDGLKEIATLPNLTWLDVSDSAITGVGLLHLGKSESLRDLVVSQGQVRFSPPLGAPKLLVRIHRAGVFHAPTRPVAPKASPAPK
jgi:hypothetical protein